MTKVINDEILYTGPVSFARLPREGTALIPSGSVTPSVQNVRYFYYTGAAVVITNFKDGNDSHTIYVLGNANMTISNNTNIKTNTGANKVLVANKVYTFHRINGVWYEVA